MEYLTLGHPPFQGLAPYQIGALFGNLPTPAYVIDQARLEQNGQVLSALEAQGILGGWVLGDGLLWCATEKQTKEQLDEAVAIVKEVLGK